MVDLSFFRPERGFVPVVMPADLAVLMAGVAARQATSPTALLQARIGAALLLPPPPLFGSGAFNAAVAAALTAWKGR